MEPLDKFSFKLIMYKAFSIRQISNFIALGVFLIMPFSELRSVKYDLAGERSISISDLIFFVYSICFFSFLFFYGFKKLLLVSFKFGIIFSPLFLMLLFFDNDLKFKSIESSISPFMILGCIFYSYFSILIFDYLIKINFENNLFVFIAFTSLWLFIFYVLTRFFVFSPFLYGEGTPSFHYPFTSPNQAALFSSLLFAIGLAVALKRKTIIFLYFVVIVFALVIFQTGSRSGALFFFCVTAIFLFYEILRIYFLREGCKKNILHIVLSFLLSMFFLFLTATPQNMRGFTLFDVNAVQIITGGVDEYRSKTWSVILQFLLSGTDGVDGRMALDSAVNYGDILDSPHNAYLDIWLNWGLVSLIFFVLFLILLFVFSLMMLWGRWLHKDGYIYLSMTIGMAIVISSIYINPLVHLKFVWVFFSLVVIFWISFFNNKKEIHK